MEQSIYTVSYTHLDVYKRQLEVIDKYGADALRLTLITGNAPGYDMRFYWETVETSRNFANMIWNATRFLMMNMEKADFTNVKLSDLTIADPVSYTHLDVYKRQDAGNS